ncbi:radical SAM protein [Geomonas subterranea]|uniref:Radical SAM protein n=1 Tax=Geomonas subterranea TaxID=2847989 RepID=A0ABX8LF17_9BACT|nr:radical SAM protein [Geomonas subterranea]QXE90650.1 radical SAM protein [Geomonas subterranea]QXM11270.1 radical SAM protein [Geomonas subterranea]
MPLECAVLGKDIPITETTVPVISPYWRLKRNGHWALLCRYEHEQVRYAMLSPKMGATLALMDGRLTFRHLSMITHYAFDLESQEKAEEFVTRVIMAANREEDAVVNMTSELEPYVKRIDPFDFAVKASKWKTQERPAVPISLNLMFSNDCHTKCSYCFAKGHCVPESKLLSTERWKELLREAKALGIDQVSLSGGDPLFRKDALKLIEELIDLDILFALSTKCYITEDIADKLVSIGMTQPVNQFVREIQLNLDPDEPTADNLAGSPGYYHRAVHSIRNLLKRGFNVRVKAVATALTAPHIYDWVDELQDMGVRQISVAAYNRGLYGSNDRLSLGKEDRKSIIDQCRRARADFPEIDLRTIGCEPGEDRIGVQRRTTAEPLEALPDEEAEIHDKIRRWKTEDHSFGARSSMTITPDGKVMLYDTVPEDEALFVGDVTDNSIQDVWNSEPLLNYPFPKTEQFKGAACYDCQNLAKCQSKAGYCFRDAYFNSGTVLVPPAQCPMLQGESTV